MQALTKLTLALAASQLDKKELLEALKLLRNVPAGEIVAAVNRLRKIAADEGEEFSEEDVSSPRIQPMPPSSSSGTEAAASIDQMLRGDAGLSAAHAADLLAREVRRRRGPNSPIPPYTRNSFVDWLDRLLRVVPSSEVMHLAARLRNEIVHDGKAAWQLKDDQ